MTTAEQGDPRTLCDAVDDLIERAPTLLGLFETRSATLSSKYTEIQDGADDEASKRGAAEFRKIWHSLDTHGLIRHLEDNQVIHGFGAVETEYAYNPQTNRVDPVAFYPTRCRDFFIATTYFRRVAGAEPDELLIRQNDFDFTGQRLQPGKWIVCRRTTRVPIARAGLGRVCAFLVLLQSVALTDWAVFVNRFGLPHVLVKIKDWTSSQERAIAEDIIRSIGTDGGTISAKDGGPEVDILDGVALSRNSASDVHARIIQHVSMEMSKAVLGSTLTTEQGDGAHSYAQANVHKDSRTVRVSDDAIAIETAINRDLIRPWWQYNNLPGTPCRLKFNLTDISDPEVLVRVVKELVSMGMPVSQAYVFNQTGVRRGEGSDIITALSEPEETSNE